MSEACQQETYDWSDTRTLYVVLQGEFALYHQVTDNPDHDTLRILAPYLCDHVYKAGPWLTDWRNTPELPRVLSLRNAFGDRKQQKRHCGRAIPEGNTDIITSLGVAKFCPQNARLDITAPMPLAILPGLIETTPSVFVTVTEQDGSIIFPPVPPEPTVIPILVYKWYDGNPPYLWNEESGYSWPSGGPSDDFQSIHIYASSEREETEPHAKEAFAAAANLLGVKAQVDWKDTSPSLFRTIFATPSAGLSWAQVNLFLWQILRYTDPRDPGLIQDDEPKNLPFDRASVLLSSSGNCGPITGG
jgi:hypothetical protein